MRVLIVEDEKEISDFLKSAFRAEHFAVDAANDGGEGMMLALTNDYDLIILDNILPGKTGAEICREIRKERLSVPIIMLSVKAEVETRIDLLNSGADDYLAKPFSLAELMARARALLRRPRIMEDELLKIDNLLLDSRKHKVTRKGKEIKLAKKEFMLLEYMLRNRGLAMTRGMIMEHVWDMNADPFSNTIESHILSLRKKIDFPGAKKLIHTIPGVGYKVDVV